MGLNWLRGGDRGRQSESPWGRGKKKMLSHLSFLSSSFFPFISPSMNKATPASPVNLASAGWL